MGRARYLAPGHWPVECERAERGRRENCVMRATIIARKGGRRRAGGKKKKRDRLYPYANDKPPSFVSRVISAYSALLVALALCSFVSASGRSPARSLAVRSHASRPPPFYYADIFPMVSRYYPTSRGQPWAAVVCLIAVARWDATQCGDVIRWAKTGCQKSGARELALSVLRNALRWGRNFLGAPYLSSPHGEDRSCLVQQRDYAIANPRHPWRFANSCNPWRTFHAFRIRNHLFLTYGILADILLEIHFGVY